MIIEWTPELSLGVKLIDDQHHQFIDILNQLSEAITNNLSREELEEIFIQLRHYTENHFGTEEKLFEQFDYPDKEQHVALHDEFRVKLAEIKLNLDKGNLQPAFELLDFLEDWLVNHITTIDPLYVDNFHEHGLK